MASFFGGENSGNTFPVRRTKVSYARHETACLGASFPSAKIPKGVSQWGREQLGPSIGEETRGRTERRGELGGWREGGRGDQVGARLTYKTCIQGLSPHQADTCIVGIVVTKHSVHAFPDKKNPGSHRFRFTFTLRDSPMDYINVTCWGSDMNYISGLHKTFRICDIVEIINGQVLSKSGGESEDRWNAWTPSPYTINVSENYSKLSLYSGPDQAELSCLAHIPLRPVDECHSLSTLLSQGVSMEGSHISLIAAVRHIGKPKEMTSKSGKPLKKCEVKLMDRECPCFSLIIWDQELIQLAQTWMPKENIILAVDVKASLDTYRNCMTAVCDQKTLLITNPDCKEAHQLFQFSQTVNISEDMSAADENYPSDDISTISEVFTIEELWEKQRRSGTSGGSENRSGSWKAEGTQGSFFHQQFTGVLYTYLTHLDITGNTNTVICYRCTHCNFRVPEGARLCSNQNCPSLLSCQPASSGHNTSAYTLGKMEEGFLAEPHFYLMVSLSDYSGGVEGVRLMGQPASEALGLTPVEFLSSDEIEHVALKNKLLLERFKVFFKSSYYQTDQKKATIRILSMSLADVKEVSDHMGIM